MQALHTVYGEQLFKSGMFSDCTIHCQQRSWTLHRAILAHRCEFFRACFTSGFQESIPCIYDPESQGICSNGISVSMHDDEPQALERLLRWIYTFSYPALTGSESSATETVNVHKVVPADFWTSELDLCIISDKYNLATLLAEAAYSILDTARLAMSDPDSPNHCETFTTCLDDFVRMIEVLFTDAPLLNLPSDLQIGILEITGDMISKYIGQEERLSQLMITVPAFGIMLVQTLGGLTFESDTSHNSFEGTPHTSAAKQLLSADHYKARKAYRRTWSSSERSSSGADGPNIIGRDQRATGESTRIQGRRQPAVVEKVHIPMNEDSDLD